MLLFSFFESFSTAFPSHGVFLLILIISANFLAETFPCKIQELLQSDMKLKHLFGFLTMLFFVVTSLSNKPSGLFSQFWLTVELYILFLLVSKTPPQIFLLLTGLFAINYILHLVKDDAKNRITIEDNNNNNNNNNKSIKKWLINDPHILLQYIDRVMIFLNVIELCLLFFGVMSFMGEKKLEYKGKFQYHYFFLGKPSCRGLLSKTSIWSSFMSNFQ